jgi:putative SOS response-associated peptidase YedK
MCGRYTETKTLEDLAKRIPFVHAGFFFTPRYNIAPTQLAPVIVVEKSSLVLKQLRWGLIPSWSKDETIGSKLINARVETLEEKPSFRSGFKKSRCLIPADSFYEWKAVGSGKQPYRIMLKSGEVFCFAGLWEKWIKPPSAEFEDTDLDEPAPSQVVETFTIITTAANPEMAGLHDRMPVIVDPEHYGWWMDHEPGSQLFKSVLNFPRKDQLKIYPVSTLVNSPKNDVPECVELVRV